MLSKKDYKDINRLLHMLHDAHFYGTRVNLTQHDVIRVMTLAAETAVEGS